MNDNFLFSGFNLPRVFLNTRDAGFFALMLSILAVFAVDFNRFCVRSHAMFSKSRFHAFVLFFVCFYIAWLTSSRGIIVSVLCGFLCIRGSGFVSGRDWRVLLSCAASALVSSYFLQVTMFGYTQTSHVFVRYADIVTGSGRLYLWRNWLHSFWSDHSYWLLGRGFNYSPDHLLVNTDPANPHNLFLQLFVDGGVVGLMTGILISAFIWRLIAKYYLLTYGLVFSFVVFGCYAGTAALFDWPTAVWLISLFALAPIKSVLFRLGPWNQNIIAIKKFFMAAFYYVFIFSSHSGSICSISEVL